MAAAQLDGMGDSSRETAVFTRCLVTAPLTFPIDSPWVLYINHSQERFLRRRKAAASGMKIILSMQTPSLSPFLRLRTGLQSPLLAFLVCRPLEC